MREFSYREGKVSDKVKLLNETTNNPEDRITDKPSRLLFRVLDIGTLPNGDELIDDKNDPSPNYRSPEIMVQSLMRYNELFRTKINIIIPADFSIRNRRCCKLHIHESEHRSFW